MSDNTTPDDIYEFVRQLSRDANSSHVLVAVASLESLLRSCILTKMRNNLSQNKKRRLFTNYGPLSSFSAKIEIAFALGLLTEAGRRNFSIAREIRNAFAHPDQPLHFTHNDITWLLSKWPRYDAARPKREQFDRLISACISEMKPEPTANLLQALINFHAEKSEP
jgi:DNA-binding MltR family transcriptional regulator